MSEQRQPRGKPSRPNVPVSANGPAEQLLDNFPIVAIGASAGGLDACKKLVASLGPDSRIALILVQHLDPAHKSMMVDLLTAYTKLHVVQAADGMPIACGYLYTIPPGRYLSVGDGLLHLSQPQARHGARLPFDFLLQSLAKIYAANAVCVVLSGTGSDGSLGLAAVKAKGGLVIVQDPGEAGYDGMPRSAINTGLVDLILPAASIADVLSRYHQTHQQDQLSLPQTADKDETPLWLPEVIALLRRKTSHDFSLYKPGTLQRRIERRMAMIPDTTNTVEEYLAILRSDPEEQATLEKDFLINVISFFRDAKIFALLIDKIIPEIIQNNLTNQWLRIWVAGCSTGEEAYSLAILFHEQIERQQLSLKLQIFASDIDPDAIAIAREGLYPTTIEADIPERYLSRYFLKEALNYRIIPEMRKSIIFTVHDILTDPPFSKIDFISCRNLLIYLLPLAQAKAIAVFYFSLRDGGTLLLGNAETIGSAGERFDVISKLARIYRRKPRRHEDEQGIADPTGNTVRLPSRPGQSLSGSRQSSLGDLCRHLVIDMYAPASVLINQKQECLYSLGPTDRYLRLSPGQPTHDLLSMARRGMASALRTALSRATQESGRVSVAGVRLSDQADAPPFTITAETVLYEAEKLMLICFVDEPKPREVSDRLLGPPDAPVFIELQQELDSTRAELKAAIHELELSTEEQKAINEEALSVNEEYQSTNEELLTSKEELQSLNEELTALNGQLIETLERQRMTSNDLQNVLYSTDVATIFLDISLNIRFFTPATKKLFNIIPSDVGRPLTDLNALAIDADLLQDATQVLVDIAVPEREIEAHNEGWYSRRILPYRTQEGTVEGVVITFADITERRHIADALAATKRQADLASVAKSRFLAAASHDLRQPLQTLALLQGLLAKIVEGDRAQNLVARLDETLGAMTSMLNALLDINQIESGVVQVARTYFPVNDLFEQLKSEFNYLAQAQNLSLRVVPSALLINSDPRLLEQMLRNLLSNALKYTRQGRVLLGCRRQGQEVRIEVWDTGIGIPQDALKDIFDEYHQVGNPARDRSLGLGLGLSIVWRLGALLHHPVQVRSKPERGSVFSIKVPRLQTIAAPTKSWSGVAVLPSRTAPALRRGKILIAEDDPEVRELLNMLFSGEGHQTLAAPDGRSAIALVEGGQFRPDIILADYNLPNDLNGLQLSADLCRIQLRKIPTIILTGDISAETLKSISNQGCVQLNKPVKLAELSKAVQHILTQADESLLTFLPHSSTTPAIAFNERTVFLIDDDEEIRNFIRQFLQSEGISVEVFANGEDFLKSYNHNRRGCLLVDAYLPGMSGLKVLQRLAEMGQTLPSIMITGSSDVPMAVQAMKSGALDFIEKPVSPRDLLASVARALDQSHDNGQLHAWQQAAAARLNTLTERQRQIMQMVLAGQPSKNIAADLGVSQRTVENHRAAIMKKTGAKSLPALARLALAASKQESPSDVV